MSNYQHYYKNDLPKNKFDVCIISKYGERIIVTPALDYVYKYACPMNHKAAEMILNKYLNKQLDLSNLKQPVVVSAKPNANVAKRIAEEFSKTLHRTQHQSSVIYSKLTKLESSYTSYKTFNKQVNNIEERAI